MLFAIILKQVLNHTLLGLQRRVSAAIVGIPSLTSIDQKTVDIEKQ